MRFVFLHGIGNNQSTWASTVEQAAWAGHELHTLTAPGFGGTEWDGATLEQYAQQVADFIASSDEPTVLIGHSIGGLIGTLVAELAPHNLVGLVNVEGNLTHHDTTFTRSATEAADFRKWFDNFRAGARPQVQAALEVADRDAYLSWAKDSMRLSGGMLERFEALTIPTMYVFGATMARETMRRIEEELTDTVVQVPGASHWVMHDEPALFTDLVLEWTQRLGLDRVKLGSFGGGRQGRGEVNTGEPAIVEVPATDLTVGPPLEGPAAGDEHSGWAM
jgi:pimeloyl-ACP methyl ester carboxylesterase